MAGLFIVLLFENPYSTKVPVTVHGRSNSAKLAVRLWKSYLIELRQWHFLTYSQFLKLKCHKEPLNAKLINSPANHLHFFISDLPFYNGLRVQSPVSIYKQVICTKEKDKCAYGNVLDVLFSEDSVLYPQADCLSAASYLFEDMSSTESSEN